MPHHLSVAGSHATSSFRRISTGATFFKHGLCILCAKHPLEHSTENRPFYRDENKSATLNIFGSLEFKAGQQELILDESDGLSTASRAKACFNLDSNVGS